MKAFALTAADQPGSVTDLPDLELAPDGVRIRVRGASVDGFDPFQASGGLIGMMDHFAAGTVGKVVLVP